VTDQGQTLLHFQIAINIHKSVWQKGSPINNVTRFIFIFFIFIFQVSQIKLGDRFQ